MKLVAIALTLLFVSQPALSYYDRESTIGEDLKFSPQVEEFKSTSQIRNAVFSPAVKSDKPGPAVVLLSSCSGIASWSENDLKIWIKLFVDSGYTVLMVDHYQPRGAGKNCGPSRNRTVKDGRLVKDLYDGVEHLSKLPTVDKNRIFTFGFSLGAMVGSLSSSKNVYEQVAPGRLRPRAVGGLYGGCDYGNGGQYLYRDTDIPLIWLMGDSDHEAPANRCTSMLEDISKKVKVEQHIYKDLTHCWDCKDLDGFSKTAGNGSRVVYKYNEEATKDSKKRVLDFFNSFK